MQPRTQTFGRVARYRALGIVFVAYLVALAVAIGTGIVFQRQAPIIIVGLADVAATIVIFLWSLVLRNSSMYDPYWSVAPVPIAIYWLTRAGSDGLANPRHLLIFALLCLWAVRLTTNWAMQWHGLQHEDWRYRDIQQQSGVFYWPVSAIGIHLMPTVLVFLGSLALWPTLSDHNQTITLADGIAALVTFAAIAIETLADRQMRHFRQRAKRAEGDTPPGLWSVTRHPNYFGEVLFWWGLYLFVPLTYVGWRWIIVGPIAMVLLFLGLSIPIMERHLLAEHPLYRDYQRRVSMFLPLPPRSLPLEAPQPEA